MKKEDKIAIIGLGYVGLPLAKSFSKYYNVIGYDWKTYDYESGSYIIHPEKNFVIKDKSGFYYKFHVIDFYNDSGQKGNIKFEFMLL